MDYSELELAYLKQDADRELSVDEMHSIAVYEEGLVEHFAAQTVPEHYRGQLKLLSDVENDISEESAKRTVFPYVSGVFLLCAIGLNQFVDKEKIMAEFSHDSSSTNSLMNELSKPAPYGGEAFALLGAFIMAYGTAQAVRMLKKLKAYKGELQDGLQKNGISLDM